MVKLLKFIGATALTSRVIGGIAAVIDTVIQLATKSYLTKGLSESTTYFTQNVIANFITVIVIALIISVLYSLILKVFGKSAYTNNRKWPVMFGLPICILAFVIAALPINEKFLPHFIAPSTLIVNSLMLLAMVVFAVIIGIFGKWIVSVCRSKPVFISASVISSNSRIMQE